MTLRFKDIAGRIYRGVREIRGSLLFMEGVSGVGYDEVVRIRGQDGIDRMGRVLDVTRRTAVIQVLGGVEGLQTDSLVTFTGSAFRIPVSEEVLGRMFNGRYEPIDGMPPIVSSDLRDVNGAPINPRARIHPNDFIQTGISAIDGMLSLVRGQKLPIFSESGLPHNRIIAQIIRQATVRGKKEEFAIVFSAMGLKNDEARFFVDELRESGALERSVLVLNLADDPAIERLLTPRIALTVAEYLAFDLQIHVLAILSDMTNYCVHGDTEVLLGDGSVVAIREIVDDFFSSNTEACAIDGASLLLLKRTASGGKREVLSWSGDEVARGKIIAVEKIVSPKKLVKVRTRSGVELLVTEDHKLLADTDGGPMFVQAKDLKRGTELYSVRRLSIKEKQPLILELLSNEGGKFYAHMKSEAPNWLGGVYEVCDLLKTAHDLGISLEELSKYVDYLTAGGKGRVKLVSGKFTREMARLLGWILSDGTIYESEAEGIYYVSFSSRSRELIRSFVSAIESSFPGVKARIDRNQNGVLTARVNNRVVASLFKWASLLNTDRELSLVMKLPTSHISEFLSGYFDGDGSVSVREKRIFFTTNRLLRARKIQLLLKRLGIISVIRERSTGGFKESKVYDVEVKGRSELVKLMSFLKVSDKGKESKLKRLAEEIKNLRCRSTKHDLAPRICRKLLKSIRQKYGIKSRELGASSTISQFERGKRRIGRNLLIKWLAILEGRLRGDSDYRMMEKLAKGNYVLDEIVEIGYAKSNSEFVYDVTVVPAHNFLIGNGIISSNCEALREMSAAREEVPGRGGYPGYMYSDLASIYERAGIIAGIKGSLTQMPCLTMPGGDMSHPIPDLTGYITEGQIILDKDLDSRGIYPPINVLPSLSRLMRKGIGVGKTREDHKDVSDQLYDAYSKGVKARDLARIVGEVGLSPRERKYLAFAEAFERKFVNQGEYENRSIEKTLNIAWEVLSILPEEELVRIHEKYIEKYYPKYVGKAVEG